MQKLYSGVAEMLDGIQESVAPRSYDPVLSKRCAGDNHQDCDGRAIIVVGRDSYMGRCQCECHNSLRKKGKVNEPNSGS